MKKEMTYLGVDTKTNTCCIVTTDNKMSRLDFKSTNWCGHDDVNRTMALKGYVLTGKKIPYNGEYIGADYDHGHCYEFHFKFNELWEVVIPKDDTLQDRIMRLLMQYPEFEEQPFIYVGK